MQEPDLPSRRRKLLDLLPRAGCDVLLVSNETNVSYLTGFSGDSSWLLLGPKQTVLISDTRYATQISDECAGVQAVIRDDSDTLDRFVAKTVSSCGLGHIGFESSTMTHAQWESLRAAGDVDLVPTTMLVESLRQIKDEWELEQVRGAVHVAQRAFDMLQDMIRPDLTELQLAHQLEHRMRELGAEGAAFSPIVAVGSNAALPHGRPGRRLIGEAPFVLVDWGAKTASKYRSDITRLLFTSKDVPDEIRNAYDIVLRAQSAAIEAIAPGKACREVDAVARQIIADAGHSKHFGHGLGHSFGLDIHESPRLNPMSEQILEPGMLITVEPGVYLPGVGGVRIEDDVLVTEQGCEVLTSLPTQFEKMFVDLCGR